MQQEQDAILRIHTVKSSCKLNTLTAMSNLIEGLENAVEDTSQEVKQKNKEAEE